MRACRTLAMVLLPLAPVATPAAAATVTLREVSKPVVYTLPGRATDVLGVSPGMDAETVRQILTKKYGEVNEQRESLAIARAGSETQTQPFVTSMTGQSGGDQTTVRFGTPATGGGVVEVSRQTYHFDPAQAPDISQLRAEFIGKYGPPAAERAATSTGALTIQEWAFDGAKPVDCNKFPCRASELEGLSVVNLPAYRQAVRTGHHLLITTLMLAATTDPRRAATVWVTVNDVAGKLRTLEAALQQMNAATSSGRGEGAKAAGRGR